MFKFTTLALTGLVFYFSSDATATAGGRRCCCHCCKSYVAKSETPATAAPDAHAQARTYRRFSESPEPRAYVRRGSSTPIYLYPKTDARRYGRP